MMSNECRKEEGSVARGRYVCMPDVCVLRTQHSGRWDGATLSQSVCVVLSKWLNAGPCVDVQTVTYQYNLFLTYLQWPSETMTSPGTTNHNDIRMNGISVCWIKFKWFCLSNSPHTVSLPYLSPSVPPIPLSCFPLGRLLALSFGFDLPNIHIYYRSYPAISRRLKCCPWRRVKLMRSRANI